MGGFDEIKSCESKSTHETTDKTASEDKPFSLFHSLNSNTRKQPLSTNIDKQLVEPIHEHNKDMEGIKTERSYAGVTKHVTRFCQILIECQTRNLNKKDSTHCKRLVWTRKPDLEKSCKRVNIKNVNSSNCPNCNANNESKGTKRLLIPENLDVKILGFNSADDVRQSMKAVLMDQVPIVNEEVDYCAVQVNYSEDPLAKKARKDFADTDQQDREQRIKPNEMNPLKIANNMNDLDILNINSANRQYFKPIIFPKVPQPNNGFREIDEFGGANIETFRPTVDGMQKSLKRQDCGEPPETRNLIESAEDNIFPNHIHRHFFHIIPETSSEQSTNNQRTEASENNSREALSTAESNGNDTASNESGKHYSDENVATKRRRSKRSFEKTTWQSKKGIADFYFGKLSNVAKTKYQYESSESD